MKNVCFTLVLMLTGTFAFANNAKVVSNVKLNKIENIKKNVKTVNSSTKTAVAYFDSCGDAGDAVYAHGISQGATHRQARRTRRAFVRNCRRQ